MEAEHTAKWVTIFEQRLLGVGQLTNSSRASLQVGEAHSFSCYGARITAYTSGQVQVKIRHRFVTAGGTPGEAGFKGIDFINLTGANQQDMGSVGYGIGAVTPNQAGNPIALRDPQILVFITTPAGVNSLTYQVLGANVRFL